MSDDHAVVSEDAVDLKERRGGGAGSRDISGALGTSEMAIRVWRFGPGDAMAYHRHKTQEEVYRLVSGGPSRFRSARSGFWSTTVTGSVWGRTPRDGS